MKRRNKHNNQPVTLHGIRFQSKKEAKRWGELILLEIAKEIKYLKRQVVFAIEVNGEHICNYIADFTYYDCKKCVNIVEDPKGFRTQVYLLKKKLMKACYNVDILET